MKLQTLEILQNLLRHVQDHGRLTAVCVSVCLLVYVCWCVCVGVCGVVFVLRVCVGCAFLCFGVAVCCAVSLCVVLVLVLVCNV